MSLWLEPEELKDALVIDSEGYIIGYVDSIVYIEGKPVIKVYISEVIIEKKPDIETLQKILLEDLKLEIKKGAKTSIEKMLTPLLRLKIDDLHTVIKRTMGTSKITPEVIIEYARERNVEIPYIATSKKIKKIKDTIHMNDVKIIGKSDQGVCIITSSASEAERRGIQFPKAPTITKIEDLDKKLIIDAEGVIFGYVTGIRYGINGSIGLKISKYIKEAQSSIDIDELSRSYGMSRGAFLNMIREQLGLSPIHEITLEHIELWAQKSGIKLPWHLKKEITYKFILPWKYVAKCGDVILLNKSIQQIIKEIT